MIAQVTESAEDLRFRTLGLNARSVVNKRYSMKDTKGQPIEEWPDIVRRVVGHVSKAETDPQKRDSFYEAMSQVMLSRQFIPNTPCLVNAGKQNGMLAACFVLPVPDSISGIMDHAKACATVHQHGGGTGMTYEFLRPTGAMVSSTRGVASGPVSFMNIVNQTTEVVKQGGVRRGANMAILRVTHPDVLRFVHAKNDQNSLQNFNISVTVTDAFLEAVDHKRWFQLEFDGNAWREPIFDPVQNGDYCVYHRADGSIVTFRDRAAFEQTNLTDCTREEPPAPGMVYAPDVWNRIVASAHKYAEPGVIFIDEINRHNHMMNSMGPVYATNPCAEQALHFNNACNLGSIDVAKFYDSYSGFRWDLLTPVIRLSVRFLDNVIDTCTWPMPEIDDVVKRTRPIGLGIMGFADLCLHLKITYGSQESVDLMEQVLGHIRKEAWLESCRIGAEKGVFPEYEPNRKAYNVFLQTQMGVPSDMLTPRNYEVTNVAPTGTISLVAETSSGIEPNFSWAYVRQDTLGTRTYVHTLAAQALGIEVDQTDQDSINAAAAYVVEHEKELPPYFISAMTITSEQHVHVLAAAQRNVDNSVSKTCNGAVDDTVESVDALYRLARQLGCKAVSYYRDGSRENQVLTAIKEQPQEEIIENPPPEPPVSIIEHERAPNRIDRQRELIGSTWQIEFEGHNLYVTVNHDGKMIQEVFVTGPISASVGKLASKMLRGGFNAREVAQTLNTTTGTHAVWFNQRCLTSPEQAIAECIIIMLERLTTTNKQQTANMSPSHAAHSRGTLQSGSNQGRQSSAGYGAPLCPHCQGPLERTGNCWLCQPCSYSKCG
jgi:ribonucleoside-diphosphate reductase alpha chain